jgi:hypothetical protein
MITDTALLPGTSSVSDTELFGTYFQTSQRFYLDKLERYRNGEKYVFNVYAFFFGIAWFIYRKMYLEALIIFLILIAEGLLEGLLMQGSNYNINKMFDIATSIIMGAITGYIANHLYFCKAEKVIEFAKHKEPDDESLLEYIDKKGGTTWWFLLIIPAIVTALFVYNN